MVNESIRISWSDKNFEEGERGHSSLGSPVGESGIWSETQAAIVMYRSRETGFQEKEEDRSAKAKRRCKGGTEWKDIVQCGEVEGQIGVGFVSQGKELGFLVSVGFLGRGGICSVLGKH